jgi:hypothetical protein
LGCEKKADFTFRITPRGKGCVAGVDPVAYEINLDFLIPLARNAQEVAEELTARIDVDEVGIATAPQQRHRCGPRIRVVPAGCVSSLESLQYDLASTRLAAPLILDL